MNHQKKIFGIIGLGRFGFSLAESLSRDGQEIIVIDNNENKIREASAFTDNSFQVEELSREALEECGIKNCDVVFVCIGEKIDTSILTTLIVIELGVPKVISRATSPEQGTVLQRLGAEVVYPEHDMAIRISKRYTSSHILEYISLSEACDITELELNNHFVNLSVKELELRQKFGLNIVAIRRQDGTIITDIAPETEINGADTIVVCGKKASILQLENKIHHA